MRKLKITLFFAMAVLLCAAGSALAGTATLNPTDDAYVWSDDGNGNHGGDNYMIVGEWDGASPYSTSRDYLKFDLSSIPAGQTITSATLHINCQTLYAASVQTSAHFLSVDTWGEFTITWNNATTAFNAAATDTTTLAVGDNTWNVTTDVSSEYGGDKVYSVVMKLPTEGANADGAWLDSDESQSRPYLVVDYQDAGEDELDWGDAPDGPAAPIYPTLAANGGANHLIVPGGPYLDDGSLTDFPDSEIDGQPDPAAMGDDLLDGNDDEDGVTISPSPIVPGGTATISFNVAGAPGCVDAWIDWNQDQVWDDTAGSNEKFPGACFPVGPGSLNLPVPATAVLGQTFMRVRISSAGGLPPTGGAADGEVEDYEVFIEEEQNPDEELKFQQLPLNGPDYWGHDELSTAYRDPDLPIQFEGCYMADDFADLKDTPVIKIKWWGSYLENEIMEPVVRFLIAFETDIPAVGQPGDVDYVASHPGQVLQTEIVQLSSLSPLNPGEYSETWISPGGPPCFEALFEYEAVLANPFPQEPNTVYWLKITALIDDIAVLNRMKPALQASGMSLCQFLNLPNAQQAAWGLEVPVTRWGWHNRDYTIMDTYASIPPAVNPGEHLAGVTSEGFEVWHFQDDAVSGEMFIDESDPIMPILNQYTWQEEYYKYFSPLCAAPPPGVDGPEDIQSYSKDLAFELWTPWTPTECVKNTASFYADWLAFGSPDCWCYAAQCLGDANGKSEGNAITGIKKVFNLDLTLFLSGYGVKEAPKGPGILSVPNGICADFDHNKEGNAITGIKRVFNLDLTQFLASYGVKEPSKGPGIGDCSGPDYNFFITP